jgi:hypothetical protein
LSTPNPHYRRPIEPCWRTISPNSESYSHFFTTVLSFPDQHCSGQLRSGARVATQVSRAPWQAQFRHDRQVVCISDHCFCSVIVPVSSFLLVGWLHVDAFHGCCLADSDNQCLRCQVIRSFLTTSICVSFQAEDLLTLNCACFPCYDQCVAHALLMLCGELRRRIVGAWMLS